MLTAGGLLNEIMWKSCCLRENNQSNRQRISLSSHRGEDIHFPNGFQASSINLRPRYNSLSPPSFRRIIFFIMLFLVQWEWYSRQGQLHFRSCRPRIGTKTILYVTQGIGNTSTWIWQNPLITDVSNNCQDRIIKNNKNTKDSRVSDNL